MQQIEKQQIEKIEKELLKTNIWDISGICLLTIGLFARLNSDLEPLGHSMNGPQILDLLLVVGGGLLLWGQLRSWQLKRRKNALEKSHFVHR